MEFTVLRTWVRFPSPPPKKHKDIACPISLIQGQTMNKTTKFISVFAILFSIIVIPNVGNGKKQQEQGPNCIHFGVSMRQNQRKYMQDRGFICRCEDGSVMFGVCDGHAPKITGHGGDKAAKYAAQHISENYRNSTKESTKGRLIEAFEKTDRDFIVQKIPSGSTAAVVLIKEEDGKQVLYTANGGDSRIVWCRKVDGKVSFEQTRDHKPSDPLEAARIKKAGGSVLQKTKGFWVFKRKIGVPRVQGLSVSRGLGDYERKRENPKIIISTPDVKRYGELEPGDHIILGSDGLWDVIRSEEAAQQVLDIEDIKVNNTRDTCINNDEVSCHAGNDKKLAMFAEKLRDEAVRRGSKDNITVLIVSLNYCPDKSSEEHEKFQSGSNLFYNNKRK